MMKTTGGKKERPDGGQEERGGAPHGKSFGGENIALSFIVHSGERREEK
jgi:hypothetical protein